ncbi:MAG: DUF3990 domain-containing protein [Lachnospiraceae bacterium]|nr:DUF3990 domain-containing protein [Lachnospiraceae bacterium]
MRLYHGSKIVVEQPIKAAGRVNNDYGQGFYCTENIELAKEWASETSKGGFVNEYMIDTSGMKVIDLNKEPYTIFHWLTVLVEHRKVRISTPLMKRGVDFLKTNFHVDISQADIIRGYRADDSYFSFVRAFLQNSIDVYQLERAMRLGGLGEQVFIQSEAAFHAIKFIDAERVEGKVYAPKRQEREQEAKRAFDGLLLEEIVSGVYLSDVIKGKVNIDELRL